MTLYTNRFCTFYRWIVRFFFAIAAAWLFVGCLVANSYVCSNSVSPEASWVCPDHAWLQCVLFFATCLLAIFWGKDRHTHLKITDHQYNVVRMILICISGAMAAFWILYVRPLPYVDAYYVQKAAYDLSHGNIYLFQPGEYLYIYPHQSGLVLLHMVLQLFHSDTTIPFQILNVFAYMVVLFLLGELARLLGLSAPGCLIVSCIGSAFLPLLLYVSFLYGTMLGLCLSLASIVFAVHFCRRLQWRFAAASSVCLFLSIAVKSNYQIFGIGLLLYACYQALRIDKRCWGLFAFLLISLLFGGRLPILVMEKLTGSCYGEADWMPAG